MKEITSVLVAGAGAIGSMVAWQIHRHDPAMVSVLAGGERAERYRRDGFVVNGERFDFPVAPVEGRGEPDLVIIACKAHHLDAVLADLGNWIGPDTLILSLLNGITSEAAIGRAYGERRVPLAMIVGTDAWHGGNVTAFTKTGIIWFGDTAPGERSPRIDAIEAFFSRVGIACRVPDDMKNRLWFKFMMNVGLNQVSAVLRRPYSVFKTGPRVREAAELLEAAMREVIEVARAEGVSLGEAEIAEVYGTLDTLSDGGKTSMCQDVEAGRKTEVELFSGTVIELAARHGIPVPVNETLWKLLVAIESSY
jgi:2-dehydropantoate 2-reductase